MGWLIRRGAGHTTRLRSFGASRRQRAQVCCCARQPPGGAIEEAWHRAECGSSFSICTPDTRREGSFLNVLLAHKHMLTGVGVSFYLR